MNPYPDQVKLWAESINWHHTVGVVVIGFGKHKPWELLRKYKRDLNVCCYESPADVQDMVLDIAQGWAVSKRSGGAIWLDGVPGVSVVSDLDGVVDFATKAHMPTSNIEVVGDPIQMRRIGQDVNNAITMGIESKLAIEVTTRQNAKTWGDIGLEMLPTLATKTPINSLMQSLRGHPAVIIGPGPSLGAQIEDLAALQGRALLIATNSAVGPLHDAGIQPDIIVAVESNPASTAPYVELDTWKDAIFVPGIHAHPIGWSTPRHILPAIQAIGPVGCWLADELKCGSIATGGSVSTMAIEVAMLLGAEEIALVGVDCSHSKSGDYYSEGVTHEAGSPTTLQVDAYGGMGKVPTTQPLSHYRHWIENRIAKTKRLGLPIRWINSSITGARIKGCEEVPLYDLAKAYTNRAPTDYRREILAQAEIKPKINPLTIRDALERHVEKCEQYYQLAESMLQEAVAISGNLAQVGSRNAAMLSGMAIAPWHEIEAMYAPRYFAALHSTLQRVLHTWYPLKQKMVNCIERLGDLYDSEC